MKLLLYLLIGAGFGELEADEATAFSGTTGPRNDAGIPAVSDERFLAWVIAPIPEDLGNDWGDCGMMSPPCDRDDERPGEEDKEPALNGWKDTDGRLPTPARDVSEPLEACIGRFRGEVLVGGELVSKPMVRAARRAEMGLDLPGTASP